MGYPGLLAPLGRKRAGGARPRQMTRTKSQAHQLRKAASLGLVHNPSAVDLDRAVADPKIARDLFVREPSTQPVHDLPLPTCQGGKAVWGRVRRWIGARLT